VGESPGELLRIDATSLHQQLSDPNTRRQSPSRPGSSKNVCDSAPHEPVRASVPRDLVTVEIR
jgi:hypothetical protein